MKMRRRKPATCQGDMFAEAPKPMQQRPIVNLTCPNCDVSWRQRVADPMPNGMVRVKCYNCNHFFEILPPLPIP